MDHHNAYFLRAEEFIEGARYEIEAERENSATTLAYFAAYQAAVGARIANGDRPDDRRDYWYHPRTATALDRYFKEWGEEEMQGELDLLRGFREDACYKVMGVRSGHVTQTLTRAERIIERIRHHLVDVIRT